MKANNEVTSSTSNNCTACEKPNVEVTNRFVVEEETIIISEGVSAGESDNDLFE